MKYLTFALAKGRLAEQTMDLFEKINMPCEEIQENAILPLQESQKTEK